MDGGSIPPPATSVKTKTKIKRKSWRSVHNKCWKLFSEFIRRSSADWRGYVTCITCGASHLWDSGKIHAGHWIHDKLDFDVRNVHPQCANCNYFRNKNTNTKYAIFMAKTYGPKVMEELSRLASKFGNSYTVPEMEEKIKDLKQKLTNLNG